MSEQSLKDKTVKGTMWSAADAFLGQGHDTYSTLNSRRMPGFFKKILDNSKIKRDFVLVYYGMYN